LWWGRGGRGREKDEELGTVGLLQCLGWIDASIVVSNDVLLRLLVLRWDDLTVLVFQASPWAACSFEISTLALSVNQCIFTRESDLSNIITNLNPI